MEYFKENIAYLEDSDFNGNQLLYDPGTPVVIMVSANFCNYCKQMKPTFQNFADQTKGKIFCATIQADGKLPSEQALSKKIKQLVPDFKGFPTVIAYKQGKFA